MVKVKENMPLNDDGNIDVDKWLDSIGRKGYFEDLDLLRNACTLSHLAGHDQATETGESCLQLGLAMADVLADLEVQQETLAAAIIFVSVHYAELSIDDVAEQLGESVAKLVAGTEKMSAISSISSFSKYPQKKHQIDNMRKMLLAMADDVRAVLIKLAERLCTLRTVAPISDEMRKHIATEVMEIYAPLANRLGVGAIKWEMEDLSFRYLHPEEYKIIAQGLKSKRLERDRYVNLVVEDLKQQLNLMQIEHFAVYGRSKHIHSIANKMKRKNVEIDEIYDATAVRILVETKEQCYEVLGLIHERWQQILKEFDDYIINPKSNGYQSLHTAVIGPEERVFEVQIRTFEMHELAEMGVAAHWKYKEGRSQAKASHERKIEWLREVLAWHKDVAEHKGVASNIETEFLEERVYVFTPDGDILDLPIGVTALDFAYHVHSQIGHRCRGAKVNGSIVPLTYTLQTGDKVEILTGKEEKPSRDWINPNLKYLRTSKARAKVLHWFKQQNFDKNCAEGHEILDKELKNLGIKVDSLQPAINSFNFKTVNDLYAALGRGDIKVSQILNQISPPDKTSQTLQQIIKPRKIKETGKSGLRLEGVGNLLTHMARCCQPLPGDEVIGYITIGRGVSIHRKDCSNILSANDKQKTRFLEVSWGDGSREYYMVNILIKAFDRSTLLRDITSLLFNEKAHVFSLQTERNDQENICVINITIEIDGLNSLSRMIDRIGQIPNVLETRRLI
ncbi:MAG: GTP diphosphokinase [Legionellales bacterium RIFCSPHIGHO2_12_FULL_35_11]|nr:MAG: GTP diphosphokinase [Legionellales bacterium RIFCSPHIGHO2_12_FULL_35_11]